MITIDFAERGTLTLTEFIFESIKNQILDGILLEDEKLPSKRSLALHLGVSVITVQNAYMQLIDEGYIYSIEKKGFFVSEIARRFKARQESAQQDIATVESKSIVADFTSNATAPGKFPFTLWSKTMRQVLASENEKLLRRTDVFGALELRRAICAHLKAFRNMNVDERQVIIGAGTESLYSMLVQFLGREKIFAVENPGYHKARAIFRLNGTKCLPVKIDGQGIIVNDLEKIRASVVHVSPSHHFPTGVVMNFKRRTELLDWSYRARGRYIIEDDYDSEFRFTGKPLPTLQSIDRKNRVIYINTFSKTLSPSFRISYMVLPLDLVKSFAEKLGFYSCQVSSFEQFTLARFIESGAYEKHINKMKNYYRSLRNNLITAMNNSKLADVFEIREENAGLHFLLTLKSDVKNGRKKQDPHEIQKKWRDGGLEIQLLEDYYYGQSQRAAGTDRASFVVNYSGIRRDDISSIVKTMSAVF